MAQAGWLITLLLGAFQDAGGILCEMAFLGEPSRITLQGGEVTGDAGSRETQLRDSAQEHAQTGQGHRLQSRRRRRTAGFPVRSASLACGPPGHRVFSGSLTEEQSQIR